jgi:hypothetical protein
VGKHVVKSTIYQLPEFPQIGENVLSALPRNRNHDSWVNLQQLSAKRRW